MVKTKEVKELNEAFQSCISELKKDIEFWKDSARKSREISISRMDQLADMLEENMRLKSKIQAYKQYCNLNDLQGL